MAAQAVRKAGPRTDSRSGREGEVVVRERREGISREEDMMDFWRVFGGWIDEVKMLGKSVKRERGEKEEERRSEGRQEETGGVSGVGLFYLLHFHLHLHFVVRRI